MGSCKRWWTIYLSMILMCLNTCWNCLGPSFWGIQQLPAYTFGLLRLYSFSSVLLGIKVMSICRSFVLRWMLNAIFMYLKWYIVQWYDHEKFIRGVCSSAQCIWFSTNGCQKIPSLVTSPLPGGHSLTDPDDPYGAFCSTIYMSLHIKVHVSCEQITIEIRSMDGVAPMKGWVYMQLND
jgi:hypothetical protein